MKKIILSTALFSFVMFSCKKDKSCELNGSQFAGAYKITSLKYKADAVTPEVDVFATYAACEKDDLVIFKGDGTIAYQDAGTVCTPAGDDTGVWTLVGSEINIDGQTGTVTYFDCNSASIKIPGTVTGEESNISLVRQ